MPLLLLWSWLSYHSIKTAYLPFPAYQIAQKYDPQKEEELRIWIEEVTGEPIGTDFQKGLKNGDILCK